MSSPNMSALTLSSESSPEEQNGYSNANPPQQIRIPSLGPVAILWDIENCPVPSDIRSEDVAGNIRMALRVHPILKGSAVTIFSAYGDFNAFPRRLREGCQRTGVRLIDIPNGRKDAADKAILVDMFLFALDNPPPSSIMLISGDVDFAPALHILGQRGYTVILVIPSNVGVSSALSNAGRFVWDWSSIVRGEGFVPPSDGFLTGRQITDDEEAIVYRGMSMISTDTYNTFPRSYSLPPALTDGSGPGPGSSDPHEMCVQPGDVNGLKAQIIKMIEICGGCVPLKRVPNEYQKIFGRTLYVSDYGAVKLVNLLRKMSDKVLIEGKGQKRFVYIRTNGAGPTTPNSDIAKINKKGKGVRDEVGSSDEFSDEERVGKEQHLNLDPALEEFKFELQEILVSYSCRIFLGCFEAIYQQRYKKPLDYRRFGVNQLEELFEKVKDVVELQEELLSKRKFLVAAFG